MRRCCDVWLLKTPIKSAPELFMPSKSPAVAPRPPPAFAAIAAIIAMRDVDWVSGGINWVVDVYCLGIKNGPRVDESRPIAAARRNDRRPPQSKRSRAACHSRESSSGTSGSGSSPGTGCSATSGCVLVAVCVTPLPFFAHSFDSDFAPVHFHVWGQNVNRSEAVTFG